MAPHRCPKAVVDKAIAIDQRLQGLFVVICPVGLWLTGRRMNSVLDKGHAGETDGV
jgi:hypothetical protein